jgi:hypothetical protein
MNSHTHPASDIYGIAEENHSHDAREIRGAAEEDHRHYAHEIDGVARAGHSHDHSHPDLENDLARLERTLVRQIADLGNRLAAVEHQLRSQKIMHSDSVQQGVQFGEGNSQTNTWVR